MIPTGFDQAAVRYPRLAIQHEGSLLLAPIAVRGETCRDSATLNDGRNLLAVGSSSGTVHVTSDGMQWSHLCNDQPVSFVSVTSGGRLLAGTEKGVNIWDVVSSDDGGDFVRHFDAAHGELSNCGCLVAYECPCRASGREVVVANAESGRKVDGLTVSSLSSVRPLTWSPNCRSVIMGWPGCNVALWHVGSNRPAWQTKFGCVGRRIGLEIRRFDWSPDGKRLACLMGGWDKPSVYVVTLGGEILAEYQAPSFTQDVFFVGNDMVAVSDDLGNPVFYRLP